MLKCTNRPMKLLSVNVRKEFAGKSAADGRTASDLRLRLKGGNDILDMLDPNLRGSLYMVDEEASKSQPELVELAFTKRRFPLLQETLSYDYKGAGYRVTIDHGGNPESAIVLEDCQLNGIKFATQDGGTIVMDLRVQFHPEPGQLDPISDKLQQDVSVTLEPPKEEPQPVAKPDLLGDAAPAAPPAAGKRRSGRREAKAAAAEAFR